MGIAYNITCDIAAGDGTSLAFLVLGIVLALLSTFVNGSLIFVIMKTMLLQTVTNLLVVSLASAELLFGSFGITLTGISLMCSYLIKSSFLCIGTAFVQSLGRTAATLTLMIICVDRVIAVTKPLKYIRLVTYTKAFVLIGYAWSHSIIVSLLPFMGVGEYSFNPKYGTCIFQAPMNRHLALDMMSSILPSIIIVICVLIVIKEARFHHRVFAIVPIPTPAIADIQSTVPPTGRSTFKSMKGFFLLVMGFGLFCLPYYVVRLTNALNPSKTPGFCVKLTMWMSFFGCVLNPLAITLSNKKFRERFKQLVLHKKPREKQDDSFAVTTGLHKILESSMIAEFLQNEDTMLKKHITERRSVLESSALLLRLIPVTLRSMTIQDSNESRSR